MIIKNDASKSSLLKTAIILLCSIGGAFGIWYFLPQWSSWKKEGVIYCDAEVVRGGDFISSGYHFNNGKTRTDQQVFEGKYSSKVGKGEGFQYGFGIDFKSFEEGKKYKVTVWRKIEKENSSATLVVMSKNKILSFEISESNQQKNDWELLETEFLIPFQKNIEEISIYVRTDGTEEVYFDELKIIEVKKNVTVQLQNFKPDVLKLELSEKTFSKLETKRKEALQVGILQSAEDDWVSGTLFSQNQNESMPIELRLKGDWLDHLKNNKWSFRVKVKDPMAWNRLKTFSLQSPATREFLDEWFLHQWWKMEEVLTPRYDFVEIQMNGKSLGVYAYEEHFEKQLPEFNNRREGVIVRFSEEGFWADVKKRTHDENGNPIAHVNNSAYLNTSEVRPFKEKQTLDNPILKQQLESAQNLLRAFLEKKKPISEIFDFKKTAKYFAICDLLQAQHASVWHNMRFYFNPVLNKLEPIGFDGFPTVGYPFLLMSEGALSKHFKGSNDATHQFFKDTNFVQQYIYNLFEFSKQNYIDDLFSGFENGINQRASFLTKEFPNYNLSIKQLKQRISGIRSSIFPINNLSLKVYKEKNKKGENLIRVGNTHSLPVEIIGTGKRKNKLEKLFKNSKVLPAYITSPFYDNQSKTKRKQNPDVFEIVRQEVEYQYFTNRNNDNYVFYKVLGFDSVFYSQILNWNVPKAIDVPISSNNKISISDNELFSIKGNKIFFHSGKYTITKDVIIPEGYEVELLEGTELDFQKGAKFLSYSPIKMIGSNNQPIKIFSSDRSANGFTILQADGISELRNVIFENLNTHRKDNWQLTGAVTFYESEVDLQDCLFTKNNCEDGLNLIRTNFKMHNCIFSLAPSDGLDLDFCNGSISNSKFINTTNDGLDISGSQIYITASEMNNCGDKGISVGEESIVTILSASINKSNIGVASKDLSKVIIEEIDLENCRQGFTAYQKKVEFGGSEIEVRNYTSKNVDRLYNIAKGSRLKLAEKMID